jgi:hypothetical protein
MIIRSNTHQRSPMMPKSSAEEFIKPPSTIPLHFPSPIQPPQMSTISKSSYRASMAPAANTTTANPLANFSAPLVALGAAVAVPVELADDDEAAAADEAVPVVADAADDELAEVDEEAEVAVVVPVVVAVAEVEAEEAV